MSKKGQNKPGGMMQHRDSGGQDMKALREENERLRRELERSQIHAAALSSAAGGAISEYDHRIEQLQIERDQAIEEYNHLSALIRSALEAVYERHNERIAEYAETRKKVDELAETGPYRPVAQTLADIGINIAEAASEAYTTSAKNAHEFTSNLLKSSGELPQDTAEMVAGWILQDVPGFSLLTLSAVEQMASAYLAGAILCRIALTAQQEPGIIIDEIMMAVERGAAPDMAAINYLYAYHPSVIPDQAKKPQTLYEALMITEAFQRSGATEESFNHPDYEDLSLPTLKRYKAIRREFENHRKSLTEAYDETRKTNA